MISWVVSTQARDALSVCVLPRAVHMYSIGTPYNCRKPYVMGVQLLHLRPEIVARQLDGVWQLKCNDYWESTVMVRALYRLSGITACTFNKAWWLTTLFQAFSGFSNSTSEFYACKLGGVHRIKILFFIFLCFWRHQNKKCHENTKLLTNVEPISMK